MSLAMAASKALPWKCGMNSAAVDQGLTSVHFVAQRKHILWDTLGA